jgi:hypothetical protein
LNRRTSATQHTQDGNCWYLRGAVATHCAPQASISRFSDPRRMAGPSTPRTWTAERAACASRIRYFVSPTEVSIAEDHSIKSLLSALASQKLTALDVTTAFCKRAVIAQQLTNCITEPLFASAIARAKQLDACLFSRGAPSRTSPWLTYQHQRLV